MKKCSLQSVNEYFSLTLTLHGAIRGLSAAKLFLYSDTFSKQSGRFMDDLKTIPYTVHGKLPQIHS